MELFFLILAWAAPIGVIIFVIAALSQIVRALGDINAELTHIRRLLEIQSKD